MSARYDIQKKLGQGGAGAVYKAVDLELQRPVAIKRLITAGAEGVGATDTPTHGGAGDLRREALALSTLQHPNIVTVYDIGSDEDGPFVVMEYLEGQTLEEVIKGAALPIKEFSQLVRETLAGVGVAHAHHILHRDLKPGNIMLQWHPDGTFRFKIVDFGISKSSASPSLQTMDVAGSVLGSIHFMAPEQFDRVELDARTDLYALGCVYFHALTTQYPFDGDTVPQVIASHLQHRMGELAKVRPDLPQGIVDWVLWLVSRQPEDRPASAAQALSSFEHVLAQSSQPVAAMSLPEVAPSPEAVPLAPTTRSGPRVVKTSAKPAMQTFEVMEPPPEKGGLPLSWIMGGVVAVLVAGAYFLKPALFGGKDAEVSEREPAKVAAPPSTPTAPAAPAAPVVPSTSPLPAQTIAEHPSPASPAPAAPAPPAVPATGDALSPSAVEDIRQKVNSQVEVEGKIVSMGESKSGKTRYLNFSREPGRTVSLAFDIADTGAFFSAIRLNALVGSRVRAKGTVSEHNHNLVIYVKGESDLTQLK